MQPGYRRRGWSLPRTIPSIIHSPDPLEWSRVSVPASNNLGFGPGSPPTYAGTQQVDENGMEVVDSHRLL